MKARNLLRVLLLLVCVTYLTGCEKEKFAAVTINGIEYVEESNGSIFAFNPPSLTVWDEYNVALYSTLLTPVTDNYPVYDIDFWVRLKDNTDFTFNTPYKMKGLKVLRPEYRDIYITPENIEKLIPIGYDGIIYCFCRDREYDTQESFALEGELTFKRYDEKMMYYYGSYILTGTSQENEPINIKGDFKVLRM